MKTIMILGVGQTGFSVVENLVSEGHYYRIILHCLTEAEVYSVKERLLNKFSDIDFITSYGDIFSEGVNETDSGMWGSEVSDFLHLDIRKKFLELTRIYKLVSKWKPEYIIDTINTGTVLGKQYSELYLSTNTDKSTGDYKNGDFIGKLSYFVFGLREAMIDFEVKKYVKVSTTGLGGMGLNMPFTHGDNNNGYLSNDLMGKIADRGVCHQFLWNLSHEDGINISLISPAAFVGYEHYGKTEVEGDNGIIAKENGMKIYEKSSGIVENLNSISTKSLEKLENEVLKTGENHVYSIAELAMLSSANQMSAITKEAVTSQILKSKNGHEHKNIVQALDSTMLSATYSGSCMIHAVLEGMNKLDNEKMSIATNNLGVKDSKYLFELHILLSIVAKKQNLIDTNLELLSEEVELQILKENELLTHIGSLGLPVLLDSERIIFQEKVMEEDLRYIKAGRESGWT